MNLIFSATAIVFLYVGLSSFFLPYVTPRSVQFGVRLPRERESDPELGSVRRRYHILLLTGLSSIFAAFLATSLFLENGAILFFSLAIEVAYVHADYIAAFRFLHKYKISHQWYDGVSEYEGTVIPMTENSRRAIRGAYFILPSVWMIIAAFILGALDYSKMPALIPESFIRNGAVMDFTAKTLESVFRFTFAQIGITAVLFLIGTLLTMTRKEIDVSRPYTTYEQQTRFKDFYRDVVYSLSSMIGIALLLASIRVWDYPTVVIPGTYIAFPLVLGFFILFLSSYAVGQMGVRIRIPGDSTEDTGTDNLDDDTEWKAGLFYFNRRDPSILVGRRFGIGWTLNFGNPRSWIIIASLLSVYLLVITHVIFHLF